MALKVSGMAILVVMTLKLKADISVAALLRCDKASRILIASKPVTQDYLVLG
jgi:hypothetical protein